MGQGEYVTFYSKDKKLSYEKYSAVYEVFNQNSAFNLARNNQDVQQRFDLTKQQVKSIDSDLEVIFIPRTLYELFFIRKVIKEDHDNELFESGLASSEVLEKPFCKYNQVENFEGEEVNHEKCDQYNADKKSQKCWHLASFNHTGNNANEGVKIACFRLNKALVKSLKPSSEGFTFTQLQAFVEKEIQFLKNYKATALSHLKTYKNYLDETGGTEESALRSFATRFAFPSHLYFHSIGLDETEQHLLEQSLLLDCSEQALDSVFLYRGSNYNLDQVFYKQGVISLSFGSSLFAGIFYDPTSSAMLQMSVKPDAYVIAIPYKDIEQPLFYS